ncbi:MAG: CopG family transcriptional regulator [Sciscionella sp.]|nr:CopG family transcriptional regulator [Sciscionella sp.]
MAKDVPLHKASGTRTTVRLDDDVAAAVEKLRKERNISLSEAVNELARAGLPRQRGPRKPFVQQTHDLGEMLVDVTCTGEVLEYLDSLEYDDR